MTGSEDVARVAGYMPLTDHLACMTWVKQANTSLLLLSLASDTLMGLLPDLSHAPEGELAFGCLHVCHMANVKPVSSSAYLPCNLICLSSAPC